jgi:hypothetical protein
MQFDSKSTSADTDFNVALDTKGSLVLSASAVNDDSHVLAFAQKDIKTASADDVNTIAALYKITLFNRLENFKFTQSGIQNVVLHSRSVEFTVAGKLDAKHATLAIFIGKKDDVKVDKTITGSQFETSFDGTNTKVTVDLEKFGAPKLGGVFVRTHTVRLKLKLDFSDLGESVLNDGKELSASTEVNVKVD